MPSQKTDRLLILGGAGMVGLQVAREAARELDPEEIVISALTDREVDEAVSLLTEEGRNAGWKTRFSGISGDIFIPQSLQGRSRREMVTDRALFDELFNDIFSPDPSAYRKSALFQVLTKAQPDVVVDCINTATAISYQDVYTTSRRVKVALDAIEDTGSLDQNQLGSFVQSIRELLIAQGVPQIVRHILFLQRSLRESSVRVYVKVGTTGTGGMGINIPYTHSEDKPSATLLSKSAIGFAHTGLLFLLARTPSPMDGEGPATGAQESIVKEIKPGAMIGFKRLGLTHVKVSGPGGGREPGFLLQPREEKLSGAVNPRDDFSRYPRLEGRDLPLMMVGADTGENGFFSIGEFQAITYPRQMEYVTPEECARTVILEILGASTGRDVLSAIDGAITEPSYRAGVLRHHACGELERLEAVLLAKDPEVLPSIAVGHLGPPRLSKLLIEAFLLRSAAETSAFDDLIAIEPEAMHRKVQEYLESHPRVVSLITTIGIPIMRDADGGIALVRGPRLNIPSPSPDERPVTLTDSNLERFAFAGWVDLRRRNFEVWRERLRKLAASRPDIAGHGSASFSPARYIGTSFVPGDVVGWILTNEVDDLGMVGRRLY
jgi:hypothetical protein